MPELPEVETIVRGLNKEVRERTFINVWTDSKSLFKNADFGTFKKKIIGKKILEVKRRGKNILFELSDNNILLIHQKISGHLLVGEWELEGKEWVPDEKGPLSDDPVNRFIHAVFCLDDGRQIALSDPRKFAKIEIWKTEELLKNKTYASLGPEPLADGFTVDKFLKLFDKKRKKPIKQVLMDQNFIVGIGNIYASEILFEARIHPETIASKLNEEELRRVYIAMKKILKEAIELKGDSFSDFRTIYGEKGGYQDAIKVYQKEDQECPYCGGRVRRIKQGGRSSFYCPKCQKIKK